MKNMEKVVGGTVVQCYATARNSGCAVWFWGVKTILFK